LRTSVNNVAFKQPREWPELEAGRQYCSGFTAFRACCYSLSIFYSQGL
jgi:hypothetical protein